jgi:hypothetical protein
VEYKLYFSADIHRPVQVWKTITIKSQNELGKDLGSRDWDKINSNVSVSFYINVLFRRKSLQFVFSKNGLISAEKLDSLCTMFQR